MLEILCRVRATRRRRPRSRTPLRSAQGPRSRATCGAARLDITLPTGPAISVLRPPATGAARRQKAGNGPSAALCSGRNAETHVPLVRGCIRGFALVQKQAVVRQGRREEDAV